MGGSKNTSGAAKARWQMLSTVLRKRLPGADGALEEIGSKPSAIDQVEAPSRRPCLGKGLGLIPSRLVDGGGVAVEHLVVEYSLLGSEKSSTLLLRQRAEGAVVQREDLLEAVRLGSDNTGILGPWPCEEALAHYCITHPNIFRGKRVVELGAGCGLAGMAVAACTAARSVLVTDGDERVVKALEVNLESNALTFGDTEIQARLLRWTKDDTESAADETKSAADGAESASAEVRCSCTRDGTVGSGGRRFDGYGGLQTEAFDIVIAADCTFFSQVHEELAHTIQRLLADDGTSLALLCNPRRGGTLQKFMRVASDWMHVRQLSDGADMDYGGQAAEEDVDHSGPVFVELRRL